MRGAQLNPWTGSMGTGGRARKIINAPKKGSDVHKSVEKSPTKPKTPPPETVPAIIVLDGPGFGSTGEIRIHDEQKKGAA